MLLLSVYETFLYYCCLLLVCRYILNCSPKKFYLYGSFIAFIPLVLIAISGNNTLHNIAYIVFEITQFLLIKLIYTEVKVRYVFFSYILLYALNTIIISLLSTTTAFSVALTDLLTNSVTVLLCAILCLTNNRNKIAQVLNWLPKNFVIVTTLLLMSTAIISVIVFRATEYSNDWDRVLAGALISLQFAVCIILPNLLLNTISTNQLKSLTTNYEQQIEAQAKYYKELASANYESRRFKHDFNNMRIAIEKLLADGKNEEALLLLRECSNTFEKAAGFHTTFDTGNGIADALLTDKQKRADLCNATIRFQGALSQDSLLPTDLCVILGNTLDNAIEACEKLPAEVEKNIHVTCNCNSGFLFLTIDNPVAEKVVIQDNRVATTKADKTLHGFGLYSLHSVVKKYNGELHLTSTEETFTVNIDLCISAPQAELSTT